MARLAGKIAFVTGAGGGIGRSICARFLEEGARVVATDIDKAAADAAIAPAMGGDSALAIQCDVGDSDSMRAAIAQSVAAFGGLNVLCNVAGGSTPNDARVTEAPDEEFWRAMRLDAFGTFLCCKYGLPHLIEAGGGSVINMSSTVAVTAIPDRDCYTAAKGAVSAMTRSMAAEYAQHAIRVNAIAPGVILTPRIKAFLAGDKVEVPFSEFHLLGFGEPVDIAHMAVYLASDESRIVTGQILSVDSGLTL